jgi:inner membrane protein
MVGLAITACFHRPGMPRRIWTLAAVYAALPDLDAIGYWLGVPYDSLWGHRGITHSLTVALLLAGATAALGFRHSDPKMSRLRLGLILFLVVASHGILDAFTNGGRGIAFFAPFDRGRYFFPVHPIEVSPIGIRPFFSARGWVIIQSELVWIWLPTALLVALVAGLRRLGPRPAAPA